MKNPGEAGYSPASTGAILQVQGQVRTGSDGSLRLDLASGSVIRIAPDSLFTLATNLPTDGSLRTRLVMQAGQVWVMLNGGSMEVETPSGTASVRGSYLSVWVDPVSLDAWVTCLEGWCQAENPTALMDMVAGEGATLYYFDPEGSIPPPPPLLRYLTQQEIDEFLLNNPEAEGILHAMIATASALPPLEDHPIPTEAPECFTLGGTQKVEDGVVKTRGMTVTGMVISTTLGISCNALGEINSDLLLSNITGPVWGKMVECVTADGGVWAGSFDGYRVMSTGPSWVTTLKLVFRGVSGSARGYQIRATQVATSYDPASLGTSADITGVMFNPNPPSLP